MPIANWSLFLIIISVHARFDATLLPNSGQGFIAVLSFQSAPPFGSTPDDRLSLEHSKTEVYPVRLSRRVQRQGLATNTRSLSTHIQFSV